MLTMMSFGMPLFNEELARKIFSRLASYADLLETWLTSMTK